MTSPAVSFGPWRLRRVASTGLGLIVDGLDHADGTTAAPASYVDEVLLTEPHREAFFALIDAEGLVVCRQVGGDERTHAPVRGRSSRGRLSQSELYHHDGCSGPTKPRVVEIRCPYQTLPRAIARPSNAWGCSGTSESSSPDAVARMRKWPSLSTRWHALKRPLSCRIGKRNQTIARKIPSLR